MAARKKTQAPGAAHAPSTAPAEPSTHETCVVQVDTHEHDGQPCAKGDEISLPCDVAQRLRAQGVVQ